MLGLVIGGLAVVLIGAAAFVWYAPSISQLFVRGTIPRADLPRSFGYSMSWIALRTRDTARVIATLGLSDVRTVNWKVGLADVYNQRNPSRSVFIAPPVGGWSFVVGLSLPHPLGEGYDDHCSAVLSALSEEFGEAHYYASYPALNFFSWILMDHGKLRRGFAVGENGVIWNKGAITDVERRLDAPLFQLRVVGPRTRVTHAPACRERDVLAIAARWSIDPSRIDSHEDLEIGLGYLATAHAAWLATPVRKAA